jgi:uncharacterized membrane protein YjjP (DUF1212 family)
MTTINNTIELNTPASSIPEVALVLELGCILQELRVDVSTLEFALGRVIQHLDIEGTIFAIPTGFLATLRKEGHHSKTYLRRVPPGSVNLKKLAEVEMLIDLFLEDKLNIATTREELVKLTAQQPTFGFWSKTIASSLAAMGMIKIWGGSWQDVLCGSIIGLLSGLVVNWVEKSAKLVSLAPVLAGLICALAGSFINHYVPSTQYTNIVLASIICLIPGLELLVALQELGTGNLVAGTSRMAGAGLTFMLLALGIGCGKQLGSFWWTHTYYNNPISAATWTIIIPSLTIVILAYLIIFQGRISDYICTLIVSILTWYSNSYCCGHFGDIAGTGITALILGAGCNYYAQKSKTPEIIILLPAILLVLPGSFGVKGLSMLMTDKIVAGIQSGFQCFCVTVALMLGLLMANAMVSRRTF